MGASSAAQQRVKGLLIPPRPHMPTHLLRPFTRPPARPPKYAFASLAMSRSAQLRIGHPLIAFELMGFWDSEVLELLWRLGGGPLSQGLRHSLAQCPFKTRLAPHFL